MSVYVFIERLSSGKCSLPQKMFEVCLDNALFMILDVIYDGGVRKVICFAE